MTTEELQQRKTEALAALHRLQIGDAVVEVQDGDIRTRYTPASVDKLRDYIRSLDVELLSATNPQCGTGRRTPIGVVW